MSSAARTDPETDSGVDIWKPGSGEITLTCQPGKDRGSPIGSRDEDWFLADMQGLCPVTIARRELEEFWHRKMKEAYDRYQTATTRYRSLLKEELDGQDGPLALARREESETRAEYWRLLKIFTELIVDRRLPQEKTVSSADGERA